VSARSATRAARRLAEALMVDSCVVVELGAPVTDADGDVTRPGEVVYSGRCRIQTYEPYEQTPEGGGAVSVVQRYRMHVPVGAFEPAVGQVAIITSAALDPSLVGREYRVTGLLHKSLASAYRLLVDEYVGETIVWDEES
jgi:hypothetical protein